MVYLHDKAAAATASLSTVIAAVPSEQKRKNPDKYVYTPKDTLK